MSFSVYIDASQIATTNKHTGIQRVVRNIVARIIHMLPCTVLLRFTQQPVTHNRFTEMLQKRPPGSLGDDTPIVFKTGDILFLLDDNIYYLHQLKDALFYLKSSGVAVVSLVHDVIPITHPMYVTDSHRKVFIDWLDVVEHVSSGIISVSEATKNELLKLKPDLQIKSFHLGCDIPTCLQRDVGITIPPGKNVLMVGTTEPRKCYTETLLEFEKIWETRSDINLIIVGCHGWLSENLVEKIRIHPLLNKNLFWLNNLDDSGLTYLYKNSDLFLFSSDTEGFGIPLVEASYYKMPLILRDTPIFREIAGCNALYFDKFDELPNIIVRVLDGAIIAPESSAIKPKTWDDATLECSMHLLKFRMERIKTLFQRK